jgi:hypothetical protein
VSGNTRFHLGDTGQCSIPAQPQLRRHQTIGGMDRVILPERAIGGVACRSRFRIKTLRTLSRRCRLLRIGLDRCGNSAWLNVFRVAALTASSTRKPRKAMQRAAIVEPTAAAAVARNIGALRRCSGRELATATVTHDQTSEQGDAMRGGVVMPAVLGVVSDPSDRLRAPQSI